MTDRRQATGGWLVIVAAVVVALFLLYRDLPGLLFFDSGKLIAWLALSAAGYQMEAKKINLGPGGRFSPVPMIFYVLTLAFGPWAFIPALLGLTRIWKSWQEKLFNFAQYIVFLTTTKLVFDSISGLSPGNMPLTLLAHAAAVLTFISVNLACVSLYRAAAGISTISVLLRNYYLPIVPTFADNLLHGVIGVLVIDSMGWIGVAFVIFLAYSKLGVQSSIVGGAVGKMMAAEMLVQAVDAKDAYTMNHSQRVSQYAQAIAQQLQVSLAMQSDLATAAMLHDVGKIATPDALLNKTGSLTDHEFNIVQEHPLKSQQILAVHPQMLHIAEIVGQHHERFDGRGYPHGLKGNAICQEARIISCADAFDAMTTDRPYRQALSQEVAIQELRDHRGTQFSPEVVDALLRHLGADAQVAGQVEASSSARRGTRVDIGSGPSFS